jgi:hypothetical protein
MASQQSIESKAKIMTENVETIPYFHAMAVFACKGNRLYRIYVRPDDLVFIWAGSGGEGMAGLAAVGRNQGALGYAASKLLTSALDPTLKNDARQDVLDETPLDRLIDDNKKNFRAPVSGFTEVRIGKRSDRHARMYSDHRHQALLYLRHKPLGKYRLGIASAADVRVAMRELPRVLGAVYKAEIPLPESDQKCGCVFCAH